MTVHRSRTRRVLATMGSPVSLQAGVHATLFRRAGLEQTQIDVEQGTVRAWVGRSRRGDRKLPPLLMLHGFGAHALFQWHLQVRALSRRYRLFLPDLLYFGGSASWSAERSLDRQADAMLALMDHYGVRQFDLLGLSYGGLVTYDLAHRFPDRVRRVILVDCPGPVMTRGDLAGVVSDLGVERIEDYLLPHRPEEVARLFALGWYRPPRIPGFALRDALRQLFTEQVEEKRTLLRELEDLMEHPDVIHRRLAHETLVVWGEHDRIFPVDLGRRLVAHLGGRARLAVLPEAAHAPNLEHPTPFNRHVLDFLGQ